MSNQTTLSALLATLPQQGTLRWIGLRPTRRAELLNVEKATLLTDTGLQGDRYVGRSGKRQVTLIQHEHIAAIAALMHREQIDPGLLRRNLIVSGLNLLALKGKQFTIGGRQSGVTLEYTGLCHPCSRMEETFGEGGYNAVRGHGGITARVISAGEIALNDNVSAV